MLDARIVARSPSVSGEVTEPVLADKLRIALSMRGGVSLSVWIGGAVSEIDTLRCQIGGDDAKSALAKLARRVGYNGLEIDVISGASAGGLNGVIYAAAMAAGQNVEPLRSVWMTDADIRCLLLKSGRGSRNSLLDGQYFLKRLEKKLTEILTGEASHTVSFDRLDLLLSVTSIVENPVVASTDPRSPVVEHRLDGLVHFRHRTIPDDYSDFGGGSDEERKQKAERLALAARCTASFPVAFEPVRVEPTSLLGHLEFRPKRPLVLFLYDGGVVDNMPVGKAVRAIDQAAADGPTERLLLYMHPSPDAFDPDAAVKRQKALDAMAKDGARPLDVAMSAKKALQLESLVDDLRELEAHNQDVDRQLRLRERLLDQAVAPPDLPPFTVARTDAYRLVDLLENPWDHLDSTEQPVEYDSLLYAATDEFKDELRDAVVLLLPTPPDPPDPPDPTLPAAAQASIRPWSPLIRTGSLLIEWCRWIERNDAESTVGGTKQQLYRLRAEAYRGAAEMNNATYKLVRPLFPNGGRPTIPVLSETLVRERLTLAEEALPDVRAQWTALATHAQAISWQAPHVDAGTGPADKLPKVLCELITEGMDVAGVQEVLSAIDIALMPLHQGKPLGSLDKITYITVSGAADSPLAAPYKENGFPELGPYFRSVRIAPSEAAGTGATARRKLDASSKLAGNQLSNFAAFLERSWRANDWMWGQLDASATLIDVLLDPVRVRKITFGDVREICTSDEGLADAWNGEVLALLQQGWSTDDTPTTDIERAVDAELSAAADMGAREGTDRGREIPPLTRALLLRRRHLEILAAELSRAEEDNPTGADAASADTIGAAMSMWDRADRRFVGMWGTTKLAALGMRAVFVGWKALFNRVGFPLSGVRMFLAPVLASVAGFLLGKRRTAVAIGVFVLGALLPRTYGSWLGPRAVAIIFGAFALWWTWRMRPSKRDEERFTVRRPTGFGDPWLWATLILVVLIAYCAWWMPKEWVPATAHRSLIDAWRPLALAGGGAAVGSFITLFWARFWPRVLLPIMNAVIAMFWVALADYRVLLPKGESLAFLKYFASFWWGIVAIFVATTLVGYNFDLARCRREDDHCPSR